MKFQISRVKDNQNGKLGSTAIDYDAIGKSIAKVIAIYMASDTLRKIIVHTVATKIQ